MTIEQFRATYNASPFRPFTLHIADGREIPIPSREFIFMVPSGRMIVVVQSDETVNLIDLLLVTDLEFKPTSNGAGRRKRT